MEKCTTSIGFLQFMKLVMKAWLCFMKRLSSYIKSLIKACFVRIGNFLRPIFKSNLYKIAIIHEIDDHGVLKDSEEELLDLRWVYESLDAIDFIHCLSYLTKNSVIISESTRYKGLKCVNISKNDLEMMKENSETFMENLLCEVVEFYFEDWSGGSKWKTK